MAKLGQLTALLLNQLNQRAHGSAFQCNPSVAFVPFGIRSLASAVAA
jgi:hypothetical protein